MGSSTPSKWDEEREPMIRAYIEKAGLADRIQLHIGSALDIIPGWPGRSNWSLTPTSRTIWPISTWAFGQIAPEDHFVR